MEANVEYSRVECRSGNYKNCNYEKIMECWYERNEWVNCFMQFSILVELLITRAQL